MQHTSESIESIRCKKYIPTKAKDLYYVGTIWYDNTIPKNDLDRKETQLSSKILK